MVDPHPQGTARSAGTLAEAACGNLVPEKQKALEEANANTRMVNEALDRAARNALQSQLLVQSLSQYEIDLLRERTKCEPSKQFARGKKYAAAAEEAEAGCEGPPISTRGMSAPRTMPGTWPCA